jgi:flagellar operon protein
MSQPISNPKIAGLIQGSAIPAAAGKAPSRPGEFQAILADRLKVSGHAQTRMQSREISLEKAQWERVLDGVERAAQKGVRESLVLVDDVALIVSVKNRTLITAVDQGSLKENVFTNIDSAVVV